MTRLELIKSPEYVEQTVECLIRAGVSIKLMRKEVSEFTIKLRDEYATQCTAPLEARIRELEEGLREVEKALPMTEDSMDDPQVRHFYWRVIMECREYITKLLSSSSSDGWIEITPENLPERKGDYLCWEVNHGIPYMEVYKYDNYNQTFYYGADARHPTHYRELPKPPKTI